MLKLELEGIAATLEAVRSLGDFATEKVQRETLRAVGKPLKAGLQERVAVKTGLTKADIDYGIENGVNGLAVSIGGSPGRSGRAYIMKFLEFGTRRNAARPFIRPTWDAWRPRLGSLISDELRRAWKRNYRAFVKKARATHG